MITEAPKIVNIKDLTIPDFGRERDVQFDPERDLTHRDWARMDDLLTQSIANKENLRDRLHVLKYVPLLFPKKYKEDLWCKEKLKLIWEEIRFSPASVESVSDVKMLFPKQTDTLWRVGNFSYTYDLAADAVRHKDTWALWGQVWKAFLSHPERIHELQNIHGIEVLLKEHMNEQKSHNSPLLTDWVTVSKTAVAMLLLYGKDADTLSKNDWQEMKNRLEFLGGEQTDPYMINDFFELAANMTILAAENVQMTDEGIKLTKPRGKIPLTESVQVPLTRKF